MNYIFAKYRLFLSKILLLAIVVTLIISENDIKNGITKIKSIARLQEIKNGKIKDLCKNNKIFVINAFNVKQNAAN